jgi:Zn-dependent alcohol dehydrogenase
VTNKENIVRAAVLTRYGDPLELVTDVEVVDPGDGMVRVRVAYCGICHSDLHMGGGLTPVPLIAGHEVSGVVAEVGPGVFDLKQGDRVIISPNPTCGRCDRCTRGHPSLCVRASGWMKGVLPDGTVPFRRGDTPVYRGNGIGAWTEQVIVDAFACVKIDDDVPLDIACLIGCGIQTGVGAVFNTAKVEPGSDVLVSGLGGVGLAIVQAAKVAGAASVLVADPVAKRREVALSLGATCAIDPTTQDVAAVARSEVGGVHYAFDAVGSPALVATGVRAARPGGAIIMVGSPMGDDALSEVHQGQLIVQEKRLLGSMLGSSHPSRDIPRILHLWRTNRLSLEAFGTQRRPLEEVNEGLDDLRQGVGVRTVLVIDEDAASSAS